MEYSKTSCDCLEVFHDATHEFSGIHFPTGNVFKLFFSEREESKHDFLRSTSSHMKTKYDKYWEECSLVLATVFVLDLRFNMDFVEYHYSKIHGAIHSKR